MLRTLLITMDFQPMHGGVAVYWGNLCRQLPSSDLVVLAPEYEKSLEFDAEQQYVLYRRNLLTSRTWMWPKWLPFLFATWRIVRKEKIKRIIVAQVLPGGTIAYIIKKLLGIPYIVSFHGLDITVGQQHPRHRHLLHRIIRHAESFIVNSEFTQHELEKVPGVTGKSITLVYPCPNVHTRGFERRVCNRATICSKVFGHRVLLTVGRLIERKGQDMVLRALPQVLQQCPDVLYVVVGRGADSCRLHTLVDSLGLQKSVLFYQDLLDEDLPCLYERSDVFVMPARQLSNGDVEGFGIVYLEANAFGKPVVAGRSGGVIEAVEDGQTGLVVDPMDVDAIAAAIIKLLANPEQSRSLGEQGRKRVLERFTWQAQGKILAKVLGA